MKYSFWKKYALHALTRTLAFPFIFLICYGVILWQYRSDEYGYGVMIALVSATFVAVVFMAIETVLLLMKNNKKYLVNIVILLILSLIGIIIY